MAHVGRMLLSETDTLHGMGCIIISLSHNEHGGSTSIWRMGEAPVSERDTLHDAHGILS